MDEEAENTQHPFTECRTKHDHDLPPSNHEDCNKPDGIDRDEKDEWGQYNQYPPVFLEKCVHGKVSLVQYKLVG